MAQRALVYKYDSGSVQTNGALAMQAFCLLSNSDDISQNQALVVNIELDPEAPQQWEQAIKDRLISEGATLGYTLTSGNITSLNLN
jgi:hypothetical protein